MLDDEINKLSKKREELQKNIVELINVLQYDICEDSIGKSADKQPDEVYKYDML